LSELPLDRFYQNLNLKLDLLEALDQSPIYGRVRVLLSILKN